MPPGIRISSNTRDILTLDDFKVIASLPEDGHYSCKLVRGCRGQLKGRLFASRKVVDPEQADDCEEEQRILCRLCHPSIISFLATLSPRVHVLEHCAYGSLTAYLNARDFGSLSESDTSTLLNGLAKALDYLQTESVIHRDINPDSILFASDTQPKLANFSSAICISPKTKKVTGSYGAFAYRSPEMISDLPYDFGTDVWAFGCLAFLCATGIHPFQARIPQITADNIYRASYNIPQNTSGNLKDLYEKIFTPATDRISSHELAQHPFFSSGKRDTSTKVDSEAVIAVPITIKTSAFPLRRPLQIRPALGDIGNNDLRRLLSDEVSGASRAKRIVSEPNSKAPAVSLRWPSQPLRKLSQGLTSRQPSQEVRTRPDTPSLIDSSTSSIPSSPDSTSSSGSLDPLATNYYRHAPGDPLVNPLRRFASDSEAGFHLPSDPKPRVTSQNLQKRLTSDDFVAKRLTSTGSMTKRLVSTEFITERIVSAEPSTKRLVSDLAAKHRLFSDATSKQRTLVSSTPSDRPTLVEARTVPVDDSELPADKTSPSEFRPPATTRIAPLLPSPRESLPIGTVRPTPLTTLLMAPKSHKALHGQVTVLPSRSLLVDFREAERRRGAKGTTVLEVSPDGERIKVYSAPHLSSPCCLTEPMAEYALEGLPCSYWKSYNDAAALVEKIKQRTPRIVMYEDGVKCTLMANFAPGDIELDFHSTATMADQRTDDVQTKPTTVMRIRFSRKTRLLELIRDVACAGSRSESGSRVGFGSGSEWVRKTYVWSGAGAPDDDALDDMGSLATTVLLNFVGVCERVETLDAGPAKGQAAGTTNRMTTRPLKINDPSPSTQPLVPTMKKPYLGNSAPNLPASRSDGFLGFSFPRRPSKLWSASYAPSVGQAGDQEEPMERRQSEAASQADTQDSSFRRDFWSIALRLGSGKEPVGENLDDTRGDSPRRPDYPAKPSGHRHAELGDTPQHPDDTISKDACASFFRHLDWTALAVPGIATRFLPDVGWCIRYGSRVSQGGRFRIMYLDGATMDIDVDEEWVELQQGGEVVRVGMRDPQARRKVRGRMQAFEEFVSMFDEGEEEVD
ncbi:hypothetical protein HDZ31DRAFT_60728 [Schizophyllum fasciatum]